MTVSCTCISGGNRRIYPNEITKRILLYYIHLQLTESPPTLLPWGSNCNFKLRPIALHIDTWLGLSSLSVSCSFHMLLAVSFRSLFLCTLCYCEEQFLIYL